MSHSHSHCDGSHDSEHSHHHQGHGSGHERKGLHFLHHLVVDNELPLLKGGFTWKTGGLWLDYGCGNGEMARQVFLPLAEENNAKIIGVDMNEESIEAAKNLKLPENIITFKKGNIAGDWPLGDDVQFEKVFAIHVLQYFSDYKEFFSKIFDKLKSGGQLGITLPVTKLLEVFVELNQHDKWGKCTSIEVQDLLKEHPWANNANFIPPLKESVIQMGFQVQTLEFLPYSYNFENLNAFSKSVAESWAEMKKIDNFDSVEAELRNDVSGIITKIYPEVPVDSSPFPMEISSTVIILKKP